MCLAKPMSRNKKQTNLELSTDSGRFHGISLSTIRIRNLTHGKPKNLSEGIRLTRKSQEPFLCLSVEMMDQLENVVIVLCEGISVS